MDTSHNPFHKLFQRKQQINENEVKALQEKFQKEQEEKSARSEYKETIFNNRKLLEDQKDELEKHHKEIKDKMEAKILLLREARTAISDTPALEAEFRSAEGFKNYIAEERIIWDELAEENRNIAVDIKNIQKEIEAVEQEIKKIETEDEQAFLASPEGKKFVFDKRLTTFKGSFENELNDFVRQLWRNEAIEHAKLKDDQIGTFAADNAISTEEVSELGKRAFTEKIDEYVEKKYGTLGFNRDGKITEEGIDTQLGLMTLKNDIEYQIALPQKQAEVRTLIPAYEEEVEKFIATWNEAFNNKDENTRQYFIEYGIREMVPNMFLSKETFEKYIDYRTPESMKEYVEKIVPYWSEKLIEFTKNINGLEEYPKNWNEFRDQMKESYLIGQDGSLKYIPKIDHNLTYNGALEKNGGLEGILSAINQKLKEKDDKREELLGKL